jgi:hypothetical protein
MVRLQRATARLASASTGHLHVRYAAHYGLKSDIAPCPKSANKRHQLEMKEAAN